MSNGSAQRPVVVTGGASGMGLSICQAFAGLGHPVLMLDVQEGLLETESRAIADAGGTILARRADASNRAEIDAAYAEARAAFGPIAIVVANAGISKAVPFATMTVETWQHMIDVNLTGVFHTIQAAVDDMLQAKWGRVITISSNAAQTGSQDRSHYAAAKGGVIGFTKGLARELAGHGITVNTIPPSLIDTPLCQAGVAAGEVPPIEIMAQHIPVPRAGTGEDIAAACLFLASDGASYITGQQINVNGGMYM